jgi:DNA-binding response OmpR family regulator
MPDYKQLHHHREKIQVGTFLAPIDFVEGKSMADSKLPARKRTIMVVDDSQDLVEIVRITLKRKGFNVWCAYDGTQVFDVLRKQWPDLILLDIMMPLMDGFEVLTRLKGNPSTASIPVILLTVKGQPEDVIGGYKRGAEIYISKPFDNTQLLQGINSLLTGSL